MSLAQLNEKAARYFDQQVGVDCIVVKYQETARTSVTVMPIGTSDVYELTAPVPPLVKDGSDARQLNPDLALIPADEVIAIHRLLVDYNKAMALSEMTSDLPFLGTVMTLINHAKWELNKELGDLVDANVRIEVVELATDTYFALNTAYNSVELRLAVIKN